MKEGIAVITGAFNPVQKAHIYLAKEVLRQCPSIKKAIFVPVGNQYQKPGLQDASYRLALLQEACKEDLRFQVSQIELWNERQLYTYETLALLQKENPNSELYLVIGSDNLKELDTWKEYESILRLYHVIVFSRNQDNVEKIVQENTKLSKFHSKFVYMLGNPFITISSTMVRNCIQEGKEFKDLVPIAVYQYLLKNNRYAKKRKDGLLC